MEGINETKAKDIPVKIILNEKDAIMYAEENATPGSLLTLMLYYRHWPNIRRLIDGTEPKIGSDKPRAG